MKKEKTLDAVELIGAWWKIAKLSTPESDLEDIIKIAKVSLIETHANFAINLSIGDRVQPEVSLLIFYKTFKRIERYLQSMRATNTNYKLTLANSFVIGYENNIDTDNEKLGNITPILAHVGLPKFHHRDMSTMSNEDLYEASKALPMRWKEHNLESSITILSTIERDVYNEIKNEYLLRLPNENCIMPIFMLVYKCMIDRLDYRYKEALSSGVSRITINMMGLFEVHLTNIGNGESEITFTPSITSKLDFKSDTIAVG